MLNDLKVCARGLVRTPAFTFAAFATLVLGLGAFSAMASVLHSVVLKNLPYPAADRLVDISSSVPGLGFDRWEVTEAGYLHFHDHSRTLEAVGAYRVGSATLEREAGAERIQAAQVTPSLFAVLGARPRLGRLFGEQDVVAEARRTALLGHNYWAAQYGADPGVVGTMVRVLDLDWQIVGILPAGFDLPEEHTDIWLPMRIDPANPDADSHSLHVIARRAKAASLGAVQADLTRLTAQLPERFPTYTRAWMQSAGFRTTVQKLDAKVVGADVRRALWILFAGTGLVLLIAGANVVNLFLVRNLDRRHELAMRHALGARRASLYRHFVIEAFLVAVPAATVALLLAHLGLLLLRGVNPGALPRLETVGVDTPVVASIAVLAVLTGLALGALPLLSLRGLGPSEVVASGGARTTEARSHRLLRRALVAGQLALALVLLNGSGLLLRSFHRLLQVDPGFHPANVLAVDLALSGSRYRDQQSVDGFYRDMLERVRALPGVVQAGAVTSLPLETGLGCYALSVEAAPPAEGKSPPCVDVLLATPGYFETMGIRLLDGRWFSEDDNRARSGPLVVTKTLAEQLWPDRPPLGQGAGIHGYHEPWFRVVGVTGTLLADRLDAPPTAAVFFPMVWPEGTRNFLAHRGGMTLVARSALDNPMQHLAGIRRAVAAVDPGIAVAKPRLVRDVVSAARADTTLATVLLALGSLVALILGTVGLYGVMAYSVSRRTREIGVRMALGADRRRVRRLVLNTSLRLIAIGLAAGMLGAWATSGLLRTMLFGVQPADPATLLSVSLLLALVSTLAALQPVRRAASVDPAVALRAE